MATPSTTPSILKAIGDSDILKGALAAVGVVGTIVVYVKLANTRASRAKAVAERFGFRGWIFSLINRWPHRIHQIVANLTLFGSFIELAVIADQQAMSGSVERRLPAPIGDLVQFISGNFLPLFLIAALFALACQLRWIETAFGNIIGWVPAWRQTLEWPNARWQTESDDEKKSALSGSGPNIEQWTNELITEIVANSRSPYLALRPANVLDANAGNILFFGHVVEQYCSQNLSLSFPWTIFYQGLADIAARADAPFSPQTIRTWTKGNSFFPVVLGVNAALSGAGIPIAAQVPNVAGLEQAVASAFETLRDKCDGDARSLASGFFGTSYTTLLRKSNRFLSREEMRRQFAKLMLIWKVIPAATHPKVFRIPFSLGMLMAYVDKGIMVADGDMFQGASEPVQLCFEAVERQIVARAFDLLSNSQDRNRSNWRQAEKAEVEARNIDWAWWIYYRVDTQAYSKSRGYQALKWQRQGNNLEKI